MLSQLKASLHLPGYIDDLARLEWARHKIPKKHPHGNAPDTIRVSPALSLVPVAWNHLVSLLEPNTENPEPPAPCQGHVLVWQHPKTGKLLTEQARNEDLLALKIVLEKIPPGEAAAQGNVAVGVIRSAMDRAVEKGLLWAPPSRIRRDFLPAPDDAPLSRFLEAQVFTLQWHITQACDLHCKHCYDRSNRSVMPHDRALGVLDDFDQFCQAMHVRGQVSFTGGNPFLHPHLFDLYRTARDKGLGLAILGNPTPMEEMERLMEISPPLFFQISLEGLAHHNDHIRGPGHFNRSLDFLDQLRQLGISSTVMLTLTRDNLDQVLPLGQLLQGRADRFTFNRLATVGEGARLKMPEPKEFEAFLRQYEEAARKNPILGLKDNLINIIRREKEKPLFGGCTGFGCGAAFNFVSLLPEGEVHACRKFSSPIGHILHSSLAEIYHSDAARAYRKGSEACQSCDLDPVCRGCLAITHSCGLDPFRDRDPFCFLKQPTDPPSRQEKGCS
jgi:selenobiotic family peptide radical SAM maturase